MRKSLIVVLFIFSCILQSSVASEIKFRTMSPPGGFNYDGITGIQQDNDGFIWILMDEEIYRFDGYSYKRYSPYFKKIDSKKDWIFESLAANSKGEIYINTNNGLFAFDKMADQFQKLGNNYYQSLIIDPDNLLWILDAKVWKILNPRTMESITPLFEGKIPKDITNINCSYNDNFYMFGYYGQLYKYEKTTKSLVLCTVLPGKNSPILAAKTYKGKLWVLKNDNSLFKIDLTTFNVEEKFEIFDKSESVIKRSYYMDKNGNFWIGTLNGLYIFNTNTKTYSYYFRSETDPYSLPNNSIWTISEDQQKNIWIGTYSGCVCYVNLDEKNPFHTFLPKSNKLNHAPVSAFAEDKNFLWIGTEGGGVNRMNKSTGEFSYFNHHHKANKISSNNIKSIVVDNKNNIWIGTFTGGIDLIHPNTHTITNFKKEDNPNSLRSNNIRKIVLDNDFGLWIAYQLRKLQISFFSFKSNSFTHYDFSSQFGKAYIFDIVKGRDGQIWILTKESIFLFDVKTKNLKEISIPFKKFLNLNTFCMDDSGNFWIGTIGNGLIKFNANTHETQIFDQMLQKYSILNICYDSEGFLWMGTDNGLISFNIKNSEIAHYTVSDGTQGQVYYPLATMKGYDGKLYFGGTNGFTVIDSKKIVPNNYKPRVIISELLIDNVPTKLNIKVKDNRQEIRLKYYENNFGFKFSSDNFLIPEKVNFKYRLKGYDDRWIEADSKSRSAFYSKVPPGVYYFEVLASNNDGIWNDKPTVMKIVCVPAPWKSWPAYLIYFIIVSIIYFYVHRYLQSKKKLELQLYLENIEKEKKEEIHQSQLRFFTNVSHDFRTPLSLIIAALERLRQEGLKEYYYRILNSNSQRLLKLVNELMDFRTVENGKMKLRLNKLDVNKFITELGSDFIDFAKQKDICFEIICDEEIRDELYVDKNILEKIVMNLLHNAFKNTKKEGRIVLETHSKPFVSSHQNKCVVSGDLYPNDFFSISIRDTGVGISKDDIFDVFERFYKVSSNNPEIPSTGIGLALVKSLVLIHYGTVTVYSDLDSGSDFVITLSKSKNLYENSIFEEDNEILENDKDSIESAVVKKETIDFTQPIKNKKKILIVEDNNELRSIISDFLSDDFEIIQAEDGVVASSLISKRVIDIIVSDIMMPRKDGITLCRELKNNVETSHIPFILLTAKTSIESKLEGADSGADIYFEKPLSLDLLKMTLHNLIKQHQQLKEYYAKNHFADSAELSSNERDTIFLQNFVNIIENHLDQPEMDVNYIAAEMSMSRSKLYRKIKSMTDMSIIEFILSYKLKKAARLLIEEDLSIREIMDVIGIESQPYFTNAFKKEFGETPSAFASRHKASK